MEQHRAYVAAGCAGYFRCYPMSFLLSALLGTSLLAAPAAPPLTYRPPRRFYTARHQPYRRLPTRLSFGLNLATYNGDVSGRLRDNTLRPGVTVGLVRTLSPHLTFGLDVGFYQLKAMDQYPSRGYRFNGTNGLLTTFLRYNILADRSMYLGPGYRATTWQPFLQAGVGATVYDPSPSQVVGGVVYALPPENQTQNSTFGGVAAVLPVGAGVTLRASRTLYFTLEGLYYFTTTDRLDAISQRGNPNSVDSFITAALKVEYAFYRKRGKPLVHFD